MMLFAKMGYFFGDTAAGTIPRDTKPERKGSHGHDSNFPDLHAMFVAFLAPHPVHRTGRRDEHRLAA